MDPRDDYEDFGNQGVGLEDHEEVALFRSLEHELESLVQRYRVPPDELQQLFEVVQRMFDVMDCNREAYEKMEAEKNELDDLWKKEKDNLRKTQMRKLELESQLEEEKMKIEHEKMNIEKEKVVLETKVKHIGEQKQYIEQELQQLKEKASRDEQTRQELLEQYKRQTESVRSASLQRRMQSPSLPRRRALPIAPERRKPLAYSLYVPGHHLLDASIKSENFMIGSMEVPRDDTIRRRKQDEIEVKEAEKQKRKNSQGREMSPPCILSLDDEFKQLVGGGKEEEEEEEERVVNEETLLEDLMEEGSEADRSSKSEESTTEGEKEGDDEEEEDESWRNIEEELKLQEDMMAVKMEVEMMQKEKETWEKERKSLEQDKIDARSQREALEQQNAELRVELRRLKETQEGMKQRIEDVTKERDEIFDNYLEQPFSEYCITRKELHDLLMRQQTTALQLEEEKEQRIKLQRLLDSKRSFLERFRERMKKIFGREHRTQTAPTKTPKEVELAPRPAAPYPSIPAPLYRSLALLLDQDYLMVVKGWLMSTQTNLNTDQLPHWMGQITLKGVVTDRIECVELGQIYYSPLELYSPQMTPPRQRKARSPKRERMILTGLHAEVWVTTKEESVACVEVIDVLARPPKVRQRFTLKPKTPHIVCMRSIPGIIEQSKDFISSSIFAQKTDWVSASLFPASASGSSSMDHRRLSDVGPRRPRPKSASFAGRGGPADLMLASTPDLSQSGYSDPICVDQDLFTSTTSESPLTPARNRKSLRRTGSDSPTTMLKTINEIPTSDIGTNSPLDEQFEHLEEADALKSEDGSSSSLRSGESGIDMTDGFFSFGKKQHGSNTTSSSSGNKRGGMQNGNRSPGMGMEQQKTSTPRDPKSKSKLDFNQSPSPPKHGDVLTRSAEWMHFSEPVGSQATSRLRTKLPNYSKHSIPEVSVTNEDLNDGRMERKYTDGRTPIMWIITEDNMLYFYPTTDPSHRPINSVKLRSRATCMEFIGGKVFVGHVALSISVYHKDEFSPSWDIENPEVVSLPSFNPEVQNDVRCIAAVKDRVWVGAGPSIFFLSAENLQREGSRFLNSWHYPPDQILPLGDVVAVSTKSSALFIFDADSANILRKFDVYPITKQIDIAEENSKWRENRSPSKWRDRSIIKTMVADESILYVGTSRGMVVAIPIDSLKKDPAADAAPLVTNGLHGIGHMTNGGFDETDEGLEMALKRELKLSTTTTNGGSTAAGGGNGEKNLEEEEGTDGLRSSSSGSGLLDEPEEVYLDNCALALHVQKDSRVRSLLHLKLPIKPPSKLSSPSHSDAGAALYHSLPNLNSSFGSRTTISPPIMSYRSLIISAGKGHMEYSEDPEPEDTGVLPTNYNALRERNEAYQLLVWGHRNAAKYQYY